MTKLFIRRVFDLSAIVVLALTLTACFGNNSETSKKTDQGADKTVDGGKWKVPTGADPQY